MPEIKIQDVIASMPIGPLQLEEMDEKERAEYFAPAAVKRREEIARLVVFGHDHKTDAHGKPIEQGIGSAANPTANHWAALLVAEQNGREPPGTVARLKAEHEKRKKVA